MTATRGERNNNPGNIRKGSNWQGLAPEQTDSAFGQFTEAKWGIRALAKVLLQYGQQGRDTVQAIVEYQRAVCAPEIFDFDREPIAGAFEDQRGM